MRLLQYFGQYNCPGDHEHEPTQGANAVDSAFYTAEFAEVLLQSWYPHLAFKSIPSVSATQHAFVTKNLSRSEWTKDEKGVKAVLEEAQGLHMGRQLHDHTGQFETPSQGDRSLTKDCSIAHTLWHQTRVNNPLKHINIRGEGSNKERS